MRTDFAYIDGAVMEACRAHAAAPAIDRDETLKIRATRVVAGFHLHDPALEEEIVAEAVVQQQGAVAAFEADRAEAIKTCSDRGFEPLAVVPAAVWRNLCEATGLFRLHPTKEGVVPYNRRAFSNVKDERGMTGAAQVEWMAENRRDEFLRQLFPGGVSAPHDEGYIFSVQLVMPIPPADVADTLLKARDLDLKVATVAEAIAFKETPAEIYDRMAVVREARAKALRDDPIIYFEQGCAVAIVAQFGDFPVEKEVVDRIVEGQSLMRLFPGNVR